MKRIHPKLIYAAAITALALSHATGCKNPSSSVGNPFLAPGRVPPPSTRALLPGEAQPYYPGDPLPVMQSRAATPAENVTLATTGTPMPSATEILKWGSPKVAPETNAPSAPQPQAIASTAPTAPTSPIASAEPSVAIPADGGTLRFATATPTEPQPLTPPAAAPIAVQPAPSQVVASPTPQAVVPASYTEPTVAAAEPAAQNPWRTPQPVTPQPSAQALTLPPPPAPTSAEVTPTPWPMTAPPLFTASNTMDVRMRAVPSPPGDYYTPTPRIRMPGYDTTTYVGSNDGFRPRSSMR